MNKSKGFTIIELVVVIAIIAILAAIELINVTGYISRGKDAAVQSDLRTMMTGAATVYNDTSSWATACTATSPLAAYTAATTASGLTNHNFCNAAAGTWVACVELTSTANSGKDWCVDSTGASQRITNTSCTNSITACPAAS